jgi:hypothetical protein
MKNRTKKSSGSPSFARQSRHPTGNRRQDTTRGEPRVLDGCKDCHEIELFVVDQEVPHEETTTSYEIKANGRQDRKTNDDPCAVDSQDRKSLYKFSAEQAAKTRKTDQLNRPNNPGIFDATNFKNRD